MTPVIYAPKQLAITAEATTKHFMATLPEISRGNILALTLSAFFLVAGCRTREVSVIKEVVTLPKKITPGVPLEIDKKFIASTKFNFHAYLGTLQLWSMVSTPEINAQIDPRITPYHLGQSKVLDDSSLAQSGTAISASVTDRNLIFSGIPGTSLLPLPTIPPSSNSEGKLDSSFEEKSVGIFTRLDRQYVDSQLLGNDFFARCPTSFFADNSPFAQSLKKNSGGEHFSLETGGSESGVATIDKMIIRPNGITWLVHCTYALSWSDIPTTKVMAELEFELRLDADKVIFPLPKTPAKDLASPPSSLVTEDGDFGTRFQKDYSVKKLKESPIYHWNPLRAPIVIDDLDDTSGEPFATTEHGKWLQEGLKIATADLRTKFPSFGSRIALRSERPGMTGTIVFAIGDRDDSTGSELVQLDDTSGELHQARIIIGKRYQYFGHTRMIQGFADTGLVENVEHAVKESFLTMVISELGGALGLRPNFKGYGVAGNWGNDLQSVMSFVEMAMPMEFLADRLEWKEHDILSFKILYANIDSEIRVDQAELVSKVMKFSLSGDEMLVQNRAAGRGQPFVQALYFLEHTTQPQMVRFRSEHADWKAKIANIYLEAYGVDSL